MEWKKKQTENDELMKDIAKFAAEEEAPENDNEAEKKTWLPTESHVPREVDVKCEVGRSRNKMVNGLKLLRDDGVFVEKTDAKNKNVKKDTAEGKAQEKETTALPKLQLDLNCQHSNPRSRNLLIVITVLAKMLM